MKSKSHFLPQGAYAATFPRLLPWLATSVATFVSPFRFPVGVSLAQYSLLKCFG